MRLAAALLLVLGLTACASGGKVASVNMSADTAYRLAPGDLVAVTIFNEPDLGGEYRIDELGQFDLPLVGALTADGLTMEEAREAIRAAYAGRFLRDPRVNVAVVNPRPVYILGEVRQPGEYQYVEAMTLLQGVAKAGGFTYRANKSVAFILHHRDEEEVKYSISATTPIQPGDTVRIVQRFF